MSDHRADDRPQPGQRPVDEMTETEPLDLDDGLDEGEGVVVQQQNVGAENMRGGGEWPHPDTPPSEAAPGGADDADVIDERGTRTSGVYDEVTPEQAATATTPPDDEP